MQERGFQRGGHQCFQVTPTNLGVGVFGADHLTLFGQANLSAHGTGGLRQNGLVAGAAATADGAAPTMEQPELNRACALDFSVLGKLVKQRHQGNLGTVKLPVAGEDAAVLVAVRVAQHDVLLAVLVMTAACKQLTDARYRIKLAHDGRRLAQVFDGLKKRDHDQVAAGFTSVGVIQNASHQAHLFLQQQYFQQVTHRFGMADDVVTDRLSAKALAHDFGGLKYGDLTLGQGRVACAHHAQGTGIVEQVQQQTALGHFIQLFIGWLKARHGQQLGHHRFMLVRTLAQIHGGQMKTKYLYRPDQRVQSLRHQGGAMMGQQRSLDGAQVQQELFSRFIGVLGGDGMACGVAAGQVFERGGQPGVDADQGASIRFVLAVLVAVG